MSNKHLYWLVACLCLLATALFLYKTLVLKFPLSSHAQAQVWNIEVRLHYAPSEGPAKIQLQIPRSNSRFAISDEQFISSGYGLGIRQAGVNRQASWTLRQPAGEQVLYYKAAIRPQTEAAAVIDKVPRVATVAYVDAQRVVADNLVKEARHKSADIESFVRELIRLLNRVAAQGAGDPATLLLGKAPSEAQRLEVATQLLAIEGIPARVVNGVPLLDFARQVQHVHWLEVYHQHQWISYHPQTGLAEIPDHYLPWWRGPTALAHVAGGKLLASSIAITRNEESALHTALWREQASVPFLYEFSLLGLPLDTQAVYRVLLTVPVGVLLLVLLRNIIGIKTFGTFMPVLIAMAFRETQLLWGIVLFTVVVGLGLAIRFYLEQLKLLLVPRLAAVLITVIILMLTISMLSHKLGLHYGLSVALFPMVILTMTIERMTIVWEERGAREALQQGLGSMLVAVLAYLVMNIALLQYLLFIFPELLFLILAIALLMGRYSGYRLLELYRFKVLASKQS
ncbi:MAG: inactive transglutaminase family protein [Gammaproteobacteria bacterium]